MFDTIAVAGVITTAFKLLRNKAVKFVTTEEEDKLYFVNIGRIQGQCFNCKKNIEDVDKKHNSCNECFRYCCDDCSVYFKDSKVRLCKECIDKKYPRIVEKIVKLEVISPKEELKVPEPVVVNKFSFNKRA
jgi:hypothetical protein